MAEFDRKEIVLLVTFWIFCPTLDMVTDMNMAIRLFRGPRPDLWVSGGKSHRLSIVKVGFVSKDWKSHESFRQTTK